MPSKQKDEKLGYSKALIVQKFKQNASQTWTSSSARFISDVLASDSSTRRSIIVFHLSYNSDALDESSRFSREKKYQQLYRCHRLIQKTNIFSR
jgi:hypothetical protein